MKAAYKPVWPLTIGCLYHKGQRPDGTLHHGGEYPITIHNSKRGLKLMEDVWPRSCECWPEIRDAKGRYVSDAFLETLELEI